MWHFDTTLAESDQFLLGAAVTLCVALLATVFGSTVGLALLLLRDRRWAPARWIARTYVSFVRGTPLLVQIFLAYYALPGLVGIDMPAVAAGVIALSLNSGAFTSEILRGGLSAIPRGQFEAARALGLSQTDTWIRVILPQLVRHVLPPMINELATLVKASALLSMITVVDLTRTAQNVMNTTYRPVEALTVAAVIYFLVLLALGTGVRRLERLMSMRPS
jgi:His/Glu/Gln/Arg/opine family amino acid ABC transporter permease subunit